MKNDTSGPTMSVADFLTTSETDPNLWWRLPSGDHQNLFDEAVERAERAEAQRDRLLAAIARGSTYSTDRDGETAWAAAAEVRAEMVGDD